MISAPNFHLLLDPRITSAIIHSAFFSTFSSVGFLIMIGTLLAEYTFENSNRFEQNKEQKIELNQQTKTKRQIIWALFILSTVSVIISH